MIKVHHLKGYDKDDQEIVVNKMFSSLSACLCYITMNAGELENFNLLIENYDVYSNEDVLKDSFDYVENLFDSFSEDIKMN